jgi:hypothetical protein
VKRFIDGYAGRWDDHEGNEIAVAWTLHEEYPLTARERGSPRELYHGYVTIRLTFVRWTYNLQIRLGRMPYTNFEQYRVWRKGRRELLRERGDSEHAN